MEEKICKRCGQLLPLDSFSKDKKTSDGHCKWCKTCAKEYKKLYYEKNKEKIKEKSSNYFKDHHDEKLSYQAEYRKNHPEYMKEYHAKNPENKEKRREYCLEHKEHILEAQRNRYKKNAEKIRKSRRERYENDEQYREQVAEYRHKRKSRARNLPADLTPEDWNSAVNFFDGKCAYCQRVKPLEKDHVIPTVKDGGYTKDNIVPACKSCNSRKRISDMEEWYRKQKYFDEMQLSKINAWISCNK